MNTVTLAVAPVFGTVALGFLLTRRGVFSGDTGAGLVRFMYYLAIPAMLFRSLATAALPARVPWDYLAAFYLPSLLLFALGVAFAGRLLGWSRREGGIAGMTASYANLVLLGFPLTLSAFGKDGAVPMFILLAMQSTLLFPLTTYVLELTAVTRSSGLRFHLRTIRRLLLNPVIASLALGVSCNLAGLTTPPLLERLFDLLANAGPGCALVALGISLAGYRLGGSLGAVALLVAAKNVLHPLLVWMACVALHIDGLWMQVAVLLAAMPCGINAFIFAGQYQIRQDVVSQVIVVSTVTSGLTASALLAWFLG